jgi:cyclase
MNTGFGKTALIIFVLLTFQHLAAPEESTFDCQHVAGNVYCLYGEGGNIGILVTDEGILIVDSQFESVADTVLKIIRSLSPHDIKYLVNTHYHGDHTGGNEIIGKNAEIIMHPNCLATKRDLLKAADSEGGYIDRVTVWKPWMTLQLGNESVQLLHYGPAHTSGDLIVVFKNSKVIHAGDLFFNGRPPFIDVEDGSDTENWARIITMLDEHYSTYTFIPGHGQVADIHSFLKFAEYLKLLRSKVKAAIEEGKSREEAMDSIRLDAFSHLKETEPDIDVKIKRNIGWVYDEMTRQ